MAKSSVTVSGTQDLTADLHHAGDMGSSFHGWAVAAFLQPSHHHLAVIKGRSEGGCKSAPVPFW